jgi:transcriptional regulator with XRE-family HTH domain
MSGEFGMVLRKLRRDAKLTLRELSDDTGLTTSRISRYELGKSIPISNNLAKLARGLKVDIRILEKMAHQAQKARKLGRTIEPQKLLESLRTLDRDDDYRSKGLSLNDLTRKLKITQENQPDIVTQIRIKHRLSMTELAKGMGVSLSLMSRMESGERRLSRKALLYLYNLQNTEIDEIDKNTQNEAPLPTKSLEDIYTDLHAALPLSIPVYASLINRIAKDQIFIHKKYTSVWGTNIVGIVVSNCLCYKNTIKKDDLLIVSMDKKPNTDDLCIVRDHGREYIAICDSEKNADYSVILQIIRTIVTR